MAANFPTALDDGTSLLTVVDGVTEILDEHHNNTRVAVIALEQKLGIYNTAVATSLDYRLGHPSFGHNHNGASGQGMPFPASAILTPSGYPSQTNILDHVNAPHRVIGTGIATAIGSQVVQVPSAAVLRATGIASVVSQSGATALIHVPTQIPRYIAQMSRAGSIGLGSKISAPIVLGRTMQLESVQGGLRVGPSGATTGLIVRFGPTNIYGASVGLGVRFPPGATTFISTATPNVVTYPSGVVISLDAEAVGSNDPGQDASITFIFRE